MARSGGKDGSGGVKTAPTIVAVLSSPEQKKGTQSPCSKDQFEDDDPLEDPPLRST